MFYIEEKSGIKYFKSTVLDNDCLVHAFSTRIGGNTPPPLNDFSLGTAGLNEFAPYVIENRKKICKVLGLDSQLIINPEQRHTDNIKVVTSPDDDVSEIDGVITAIPNLVLMLLFADCTPIILFSPEHKVLGVIHAGWRGTAKKIVQKAISIFEKDFNVASDTIRAAIGPAIGQCCYPVSEEVVLELQNTVDHNYDKIFKKVENTDEVKVDLKKLNQQQLLEVGVTKIDILDDCTSCKNSLFYSYRAEKGKTGRHSAIASLR